MEPHAAEPVLDRVYAAPMAPPQAEARLARASKHRARAGKLFGASVLAFGITIVVMIASTASSPGVPLFALSALLALAGAGFSVAALVIGGSAAGGTTIAGTIALAGVNLGMTFIGMMAAWFSTMTFSRGRQIRAFGKVLLPPVETSGVWATSARSLSGVDFEVDVDDPTARRALADQWRENGRTEHASVAAFARLTLDLMALGAPPQLVADANRDALDEIRHAQLCFGLACALDGRAESPGAFPAAASARTLSSVRAVAFAQLAVDSLVDGALHEGLSARVIAKLARRCVVPSIQTMLKEIAADEGRHARHGWDVALWCLGEGGEPVARALEGALRALPSTMSSPLPDAARDGSWERWGIMGEALEAEEHEATRAHVEVRCREAIRAARALRHAGFGYGNVAVG